MRLARRKTKFLPLLALAAAAFACSAFGPEARAQTAAAVAPASGKVVKWKLLGGKDNEFFFAIPETSTVFADENFYLDQEGYSRVDSLRTMVCRTGRTVLQISLYEGAAKDIKKELVADARKGVASRPAKTGSNNALQSVAPQTPVVKESTVNGFELTDIAYEATDHFVRVQIYRFKSRVYYLQTVSREANSEAARGFLESVKLVNENQVVSPNLDNRTEAAAAAKMLLPRPIVEAAAPAEAGPLVAAGEADRQVVVVYMPSPERVSRDAEFDRGFYQLNLKVTFQSDGRVGSIETITKTSKEIEKRSIEAAKGIIFLPAKKTAGRFRPSKRFSIR